MLETIIDELRSLLPLARGDERAILARNIARLEQMVPPVEAVPETVDAFEPAPAKSSKARH